MTRAPAGVSLVCYDGTIIFGAQGEVRAGAAAPGAAGRTFSSELASDQSISVAAPTAPQTFPPGQPATLLAVTIADLRAGDVLITVSGSFYLVVDDNGVDEQPVLQLQLWLDGVEIPAARCTNLFYWIGNFPTLLDAISVPGNIVKRVANLSAGAHTFELRWGVQGGVASNPGSAPSTSAFVGPTDGHCVLVVQEI